MNISKILSLRSSRTLAAGVALAGLMAANTANANFAVAVCSTIACATNVVVDDDTASDVFNPVPGIISTTFTNFQGFFKIDESATSKPIVGAADSPSLNLQAKFFALPPQTGPLDVWIYATDTGFTGNNVVQGSFSATMTQGSATIEWGIWADYGNNRFSVAVPLINFAPVVAVVGSTSNNSLTTNIIPGSSNPYSLTIGAHIHVDAVSTGVVGDTAGQLVAVGVPEPATLGLLGMGLMGLGGAARRRKAKAA